MNVKHGKGVCWNQIIFGLYTGSSIMSYLEVYNTHFQVQLNELCVKEMSPDEYYFQKPCFTPQVKWLAHESISK
jgi:hypothetical protein